MIDQLPVGTIEGVVISAVAHEGLRVTVDGKPARFAILTEDGQLIDAGNQVTKEAEAVAVNNYRNFLQGKGHLRVLSNPLSSPAGKRAA